MNEYGIDPLAIKQAAYDQLDNVEPNGCSQLHAICRITSYNYPDIIGDYFAADIDWLHKSGRERMALALEIIYVTHVADHLTKWGRERIAPVLGKYAVIA